jgi:hypothetical protein
MPLYDVKFEDALFTSDMGLDGTALSEPETAAWRPGAAADGVIPDGVHAVVAGSIFLNARHEVGELRMTASVMLRLETVDQDTAYWSEPPADLLNILVARMVADRPYRLKGYWEASTVEEAHSPPAARRSGTLPEGSLTTATCSP